MQDWIARAVEARTNAYAPYSNFSVGAVLVDLKGDLYAGCNVENLSYGLAMCAERVAIGNALVRGIRRFQAVVVVADTDEPISPCGACRQVLAEFAPDLRVILATLSGKTWEGSLADLLPRASTGILNRP